MTDLIRRILFCFLVLHFFILVIPQVFAQALPTTSNHPPSKIRISALGSTEKRGIFYIDYLQPLLYSKEQDALLFFNPKQNLYTPSSEETNLGLGLRKIFADKYILGAHFFFDRKAAHSNKLYSQLGAGVEFLSKPFDLRFNYYDPTTKAKVVDEFHEFGSTTLVNVKGMEEPLGGYDFEFGFPVFPAKINTRLYFGGFFFNSTLGKDSNGYRIRSETNITDWFTLEMTSNSRNSGEGEFIGGMRVTIPFGPGKAAVRQDPSKVIPSDFYIQDRLLERVVRDIDVQSSSVAKREDVPGINMIYVDNTKPVGGDGTLAHPYNTLQGALSTIVAGAGAGKRIYIFKGDGTTTGYKSAAGYTLVDDLVLWGSGYDGGYQGLPVAGYPMIDANASAVNPVITLGNNNTVMGLDLEHGKYGIYGYDKSGASILHNDIANNLNNGIAVYNSTAGTLSDFTFTGNTITGNANNGILVYNIAAGTLSDFTFTDNTVTGNTNNGIYVYNQAAGTSSDFTFIGNTASGNVWHGICVYNQAAGTFSDFTFTGNNTNGNSWDGMYMRNSVTGNFSDLIFTENDMIGNGWNGIRLVKSTGSMSGINLGDGTVGGNNSIYDNGDGITYFDVNNTTGVSGLLAQYNWWGQDGDPSGQVSGSVTYSPWLHSAP